ncbi:EAL domain-containing protein [Pseudooceanicola sp. CBS1P-1]|nr:MULTISPECIES: EAL domain-containing protein [Pseudooceanicola]MBT9386296.1 EAL domain-containing protein [Pseudooceanicola endophyticus]
MPAKRLLEFMLNAMRQAPFPYVFLTPDLIVEYHNDDAAAWFGQSGQPFTGQHAYAILTASERAVVAPYMDQAMAGTAVNYRRTMPYKGGDRTSIAHYIPELLPDGRLLGIHVFIWDITAQRRSEHEARTFRNRFEVAFNYSPVGMAIMDRHGQFLEVNDAFCDMLEYSREEMLQPGFRPPSHPEDLARDQFERTRLLAGDGDSYMLEKRYTTRGGQTLWSILSTAAVRNGDGSVSHFVSQILDITTRKRTEERLHREHELARTTLRSIGDGVITCDAACRITELNLVAEELTGWSTAEARGRPVDEVFRVHDPSGAPVPCPLAEALRLGRVVELTASSTLHARGGALIAVEDSAAPIRNRAGEIVGGVLVFHDVTEQRAMARKLEFMAHHDALTGLPNRSLFKDRLATALRAARRDDSKCAVLFCDIDRFKVINDAQGHAQGDAVLKAVADRLSACVREGDTVCRWAGDEFTILLPRLPSEREAAVVAQRILQASRDPLLLGTPGGRVDVSLSIGVGLYPDDGIDGEALLSAADGALYEVKRTGRNAFLFHRPEFNAQTNERLRQERRLRTALDRDSFVVHYQPRISFDSGRVVGAEALVRMREGDTLIMPGAFIRVAEEAGLIGELTRVVFRQACRQAARWRQGPLRDMRISVNLSPVSLQQPDFIEEVTAELAGFGLSPDQFEFEITEGVLIGANPRIQEQLDRLRDLGFRLSLDDFGTGFSNLSYLRRLPVDTLKIDRSFVSQPELDRPIVEAIIGLGRSLQMKVVVEGVETGDQESALRRLGCHEGQGFLYAPALPAEALELFCAERTGCATAYG